VVRGLSRSGGQFAHLGPGSEIGECVHIGDLVETRKAKFDTSVKANLTHVGDAEVGEGTNIAAGTITSNYDCQRKHVTRIGNRLLLGSDHSLVAPIRVGECAMAVACGRQITKDGGAAARGVQRQAAPTGLRGTAAFVVALLALFLLSSCFASSQTDRLNAQKIAAGVWFLPGDASKGYCNNIVIEMKDYLLVVDANYPGRARELVKGIGQLSAKPVRFVFDTHAHRDHTYGNIVWTRAGATTFAYQGVADEMDRYEPERWLSTAAQRDDVRSLNLKNAPRPQLLFRESPFILKDSTREVQFYFLGWAHTRGDGFVWLPKERILCTGDAAVNVPGSKLWDANLANWPRVLAKALEFQPLYVLPGHGGAGGPEILTGQRAFIEDLYSTVQQGVNAGKTLEQIEPVLPKRDRDWTPKDPTDDFAIAYAEITQHKPAGALPHVWR
jgi:cyclase